MLRKSVSIVVLATLMLVLVSMAYASSAVSTTPTRAGRSLKPGSAQTSLTLDTPEPTETDDLDTPEPTEAAEVTEMDTPEPTEIPEATETLNQDQQGNVNGQGDHADTGTKASGGQGEHNDHEDGGSQGNNGGQGDHEGGSGD